MRARTRRSRRPILDKKTQTLIPTEYEECKAFYDYACLLGFKDDLVKQANERMGDPGWFIKALERIGFKKGLSDYQYTVSNTKYHTLWIEMKRRDERGKKTKPEQDAWIERMNKNGHYASYAYGCEDAIKIYTAYVNNLL